MTQKDTNEYIKCKCAYCGEEFLLISWLVEKYKSEEEPLYCSSECRYAGETGNNGEEY